MKVKLEGTEISSRGIEIVSETAEDKAILWNIWIGKGKPVAVYNLNDGNIVLVVAPTELEEK